VGGNAARVVDFQAMLGRGLPWAVALVGLAILALLFAFTGSLLIPLKTIVTTALSIGAALGITAWVYQDGHLAAALGTQGVGALNIVTVPLVAAIAFGLAMDYEVFIATRIREAHARGQSPRQAVVSGFQASARVVVAAALIMISVFSGFVGSGSALIKMVGFGMAAAVLFDAFVVRMAFVPAALSLLGKAAWWMPRRLERALPRVDVEGEALSASRLVATEANGVPVPRIERDTVATGRPSTTDTSR
jgi:RND superfamily putative drug exporter